MFLVDFSSLLFLYSSNSSHNAFSISLKFCSSKENPAASVCPPYAINLSPILLIAVYILKSNTLLADPFKSLLYYS